MELKPINAVCIYHKGSYDNLRDSYNIILNYIEKNRYEITESIKDKEDIFETLNRLFNNNKNILDKCYQEIGYSLKAYKKRISKTC